jgi:hypothetical protein
MKKIVIVLVVLLIAIGGYFAWLKWSPNKFTDVFYLIPDDAVMVVETQDPINNWQTFSSSEMWSGLKTFPPFAEITRNADVLDEVIKSNQQVFGLLGQRHLLISIHMTKAKDYDFVYYADMQEASKSSMIKASLVSVIKQFGFSQTVKKVGDLEVNEFLDPQTREVLSICFVNNYLVCSYNKGLIEKVVTTSQLPASQLGTQARFDEIDRLTSQEGLCRIFVNYKTLHQYMGVYMEDVSDLKSLFTSLHYTGFDINLKDNLVIADGSTVVNDSLSSALQALSVSGKSNSEIESIFSEKTSFLFSLGFTDFNTFYSNFEKVLKADAEAYAKQDAAVKKLEKFLKINIQEQLFDWMGSEIGIAQYETDVLIGNKVKNVMAIKAKDIALATEQLAYIEKQIRKRTPLKFKELNYKNYPIKYLEVKGLFKTILGNMFEKIEKPYYTFLGDFVVLSDDPKTLLMTIDDFIEQKTLSNKEDFRTFRGQMPEKISVLAYVSPDRHFGNFKGLLNKESWESSKKNQNHIRSFQQIGLSLSGDGDVMRTVFCADFRKWEKLEELPIQPIDTASIDLFQDTLSALDLFIVSNFQDNMSNAYYESGQVKTSVEMEGKLMDGAYIEYYENGIVKVKGQYKKGVKTGTWKYYSPNGVLEKRDKPSNTEEDNMSFWDKILGRNKE